MKSDDLIRDFGIVPGSQPPPSGKVRSEMRTRTIIGQWIATILFGGLFLLGGIIPIGVAIFVRMQPAMRYGMIGLGIVFLCMFVFILNMLAQDNVWVELDGDIIRSKGLYTRKITERNVRDINDIRTEVLAIRTLTVKIVERINGRIRGFSIRFHDLPKGMKVFRPEMTNVADLISALIARMSRHGELAPEIITFEGKPLVRRVTWAKQINYASEQRGKVS